MDSSVPLLQHDPDRSWITFKILKKCVKRYWNFQRGWWGGGGGLKKIPFVGEVWIFFGTSHWQYYHIVTESVLILQGGIRQRSLLIYV